LLIFADSPLIIELKTKACETYNGIVRKAGMATILCFVKRCNLLGVDTWYPGCNSDIENC